MKRVVVVPSILSANFCRLGEEIEAVLEAGCNLIHFDVMDNHYVSNLTMGSMILKSIKESGIKVFFDVHLMASPVDSLISSFKDLNVQFITIHPESTNHLDRTIQLIKKMDCGVGLALNPSTSLHFLDYVIDKLDLILVMAVNPGFGGQKFLKYVLKKIQQVRSLIDNSQKNILLSVDGGISLSNVVSVIRSGADCVVVGSAIFHSDDYLKTIRKLKGIIIDN